MISSSDGNVRQHIKLYYSKLLSGTEFSINDLKDTYVQMAPSIHHKLQSDEIDVDVLSYCLNRLPPQIFFTKNIILSQSRQLLIDDGYDINNWNDVKSNNRRRKTFCSPALATIACIITSDADIDDIINALIAVEIELTKIKIKIKSNENIHLEINEILNLTIAQWKKLSTLFGSNHQSILELIKFRTPFYVKLVGFQESNYVNLVSDWWQKIQQKTIIIGIENIPVYFISSNLHSLLNITGGYVTAHQPEIYEYLQFRQPELYKQYQEILSDPSIIRKEDFFYFVSNLYFKNNQKALLKKLEWENDIGIKNLDINHDIDCNGQLIPISSLANSQFIDPSLIIKDKTKLANSNAVIINIDYPLGYTAYLILSQMLATLKKLAGVYVVGKAAILQGEVGDVQIPNIVFDERLNNVISFDNTFNTNIPKTSKNFSVLNNQKAISVQGVILENKSQIDNYLKTNFNIIEMESGSYLSAIAQKYNFNGEFTHNQVSKLSNLPFDLGIINYASDNPLSANLGQGTLAMKGVEPTYASLLAIVQRIIELEESRPLS